MKVTLVRHALPETNPDVPPEQWELGPAGRSAARALAADLPRDAPILASDEPKARQTAEEIVAANGGTIRLDPRVRETRRPHEWRPDFRDRVRAYLAGADHPGWEPRDEVARRFDAAVREHAPLVVVSHGQALTLWLVSLGAITDAAGFWTELSFPDAWVVDLDERTYVRV